MRSFFYAVARLIGDLTALSKGPGPMAKRGARKVAYKSVAKLLRGIGL